MWDSNATPPAYVPSYAKKTTFDDGTAMIKALSDIYEGAVKSSIPPTINKNHKFNWTDPGSGIIVEGFVDIDPSRNPQMILRSIYIVHSSF